MAEQVKPKASSKRQEVRQHLLKAVDAEIAPVPISAKYRCGIVLIGGVMLLLPVAYLALLLLLGHTVYWHAMYMSAVSNSHVKSPSDFSGWRRWRR